MTDESKDFPTKKSREYFEASHLSHLMLASGEMFCTVNFQGEFQFLSPGWLSNLGFEMEDLVGESFSDFIIRNDQDTIFQIVEDLSGEKGSSLCQNQFKSKDGKLKWLSWRFLVDAENQIYFILARDVTKKEEIRKQLEESEARLESLVKTRTAELSKIIFQQNMDYYLLSLILHPLLGNKNTSKTIQTELFVRQKKRVLVKGKTIELGGDVCFTENIIFSEKNYIFFMNADAMGKSTQGFSGALIMGTLINSIFSRYGIPTQSIQIEPKAWMTALYHELQRCFAVFDGFMLMSCCMGLISEDTGNMLYFNAEHPFTALYSENRASFIEDESTMWKLGSGMPSKFKLYQFQLEPGDTLIAGSDGRDDINIAKNSKMEFNMEETIFLQVLEQAKAELPRIAEIIEDAGDIIDDLSLLKISYRPILGSEKQNLIERVIAFVKQKQFSKALELLGNIGFSTDSFLVSYYRGLCLEKTGKQLEALSELNRAYEKNKNSAQVCYLLAKIFYQKGNYSIALNFIKQVKSLKEENPKVKKLEHALRRL